MMALQIEMWKLISVMPIEKDLSRLFRQKLQTHGETEYQVPWPYSLT